MQTQAKRRSTRVLHAVFLTVSGNDGYGRSFREETGTLELSFQGCRYFSKHSVPRNSWLTLEMPGGDPGVDAHCYPARVAWVRKCRNLPHLFQIGVELDQPGNIWNLSDPPEDWQLPSSTRAVVDRLLFEREVKDVLAIAESGTYYQLLRVTSDCSPETIRRRYHELMRKFHPDRHATNPALADPLNKLAKAINTAYQTLTDDHAREAYDRTMMSSRAYVLGGEGSSLQKAVDECVEKARASFRALNYGGAILWLRKAVELDPQSARCHALLGRSLSVVPAYRRDAIEHYEKALQLDSLNTAVYFYLGKLYEEMKLPWRASLCYERVLEIDPENANAQEELRRLNPAKDEKAAGQNVVARILRHIPK
jgi:tetratricopeptide (TPR) repeat protein